MFPVKATSVLLLVVLISSAGALPVPEEVEPSTATATTTTTTTTTTEEPTDYSPPSLIVIGDDIDSGHGGDDVDTSEGNSVDTKQKRHPATTISPEELESRRQAFIMSLGGGGGGEGDDGGGGGALTSSLTGLGSLATDVVSLLTANSNETFAPLREAKQRARQNFPGLGSNINTFFASARRYIARAWRGLAKNVRVKLTNIFRFTLQVVTRLATTVGGLYNVFISLLDVATMGATNAAKLGSRLLSFASGAGVRAIASGTGVVRGIVSNRALLKPFNQAVKVGRGFVNGVSEDLFDKVEWTNEGIQSKLELAQALAPNFLLRAHENVAGAASRGSSAAAPGGSGSVAGYSKLHGDDDDPTLVALASGVEQMMREGRETDTDKATSTTEESSSSSSTTEESSSSSSSSSTTEGSSSSSSTTEASSSSTTDGTTSTSSSSISTTSSGSTTDEPPPHPQGLLNDIFGLQEQINELKQAIIDNGTESSKKGDNSS